VRATRFTSHLNQSFAVVHFSSLAPACSDQAMERVQGRSALIFATIGPRHVKTPTRCCTKRQ